MTSTVHTCRSQTKITKENCRTQWPWAWKGLPQHDPKQWQSMAICWLIRTYEGRSPSFKHNHLRPRHGWCRRHGVSQLYFLRNGHPTSCHVPWLRIASAVWDLDSPHRLSSCVMIKSHCCSYSRSWRIVPLSCAQVPWGDSYLLAGRVWIPPALWCTSRLQGIAGSIPWGMFRTMSRKSSTQSPLNHLVPMDSLEVIFRLRWPCGRGSCTQSSQHSCKATRCNALPTLSPNLLDSNTFRVTRLQERFRNKPYM